MIDGCFRVTGTGDSVQDFSDLTKLDEVLASLTQIPEEGMLVFQDETQRFRKTTSSSYTQDTAQKRRRTQLYSTERYGMQIPGTENYRQELRCGDMRERLSCCNEAKEMANAAVAKENKEIALRGSPKGNVRKVTRAASGTMKGKGKRQNPTRSLSWHSNRSSKGDDKGKGPRGICPSGNRDQPACCKYMQEKCTSSSCDCWQMGASSSKKMVHSCMMKTRTVKERSTRRTHNQTRQQPPWF